MFLNKKNQIKENHVTSRAFSYLKGVVSLNFTLRTDIKDDLYTFRELLKKSLDDISEEINKE